MTVRFMRSSSTIAGQLCATAWLVFGLTACGSGVTAAPPKPVVPEQRGLIVDPSAGPVLVAGERFEARAEVLGMKVGVLDFSVRHPCQPELDENWKLEAKLSTAGLVRWFNDTKGKSTTVVHPTRAVPVFGRTRVDDGDQVRTYRIDHKGDSKYWYKYENSDGQVKKGTVRVPDEEIAYDTQSATMVLRSWRPAEGERGYFYVVLGRKLWRADVQNHGVEALQLEDGPIRTLRYSGTAHRAKLKPGEEYTPRKFSVWFTDDEHRIPIRVAGDGSIGSVTFYLEHHSMDAPCVPDSELPKVGKGRAPKSDDAAGTTKSEDRAASSEALQPSGADGTPEASPQADERVESGQKSEADAATSEPGQGAKPSSEGAQNPDPAGQSGVPATSEPSLGR